MGHARALISIGDEKKQLKLYGKILSDGWSVRKIEEAVKGKDTSSPKKSSSSSGTSPMRGDSSFNGIETRLRHKFGTKIVIRKNTSGGGEVAIEYYSPDDLDRIIELLEE